MLYIGVDLGTSAVKLLLMNGEGKIEKIVSREYPLSFPHPGWFGTCLYLVLFQISFSFASSEVKTLFRENSAVKNK